MDSEDWAAARVAELHESKEDPNALVGFLRTMLGVHQLGPFNGTVTSVPMEAVVMRSNGRVERGKYSLDRRSLVEICLIFQQETVGHHEDPTCEQYYESKIACVKCRMVRMLRELTKLMPPRTAS